MTVSINREERAHITIPSHDRHIARVREFIATATRGVPLTEDERYDIVLAAVEAVTNAIRHSKSPEITLDVSSDRVCVTVRVIDRGLGFAFRPEACEFPCLEELGGRGLPLMFNLMDDLVVKSEPGKGTEVVLVKKLARETHGPRPAARAAHS